MVEINEENQGNRILSPKEFISIGNTIAKFTYPLDMNPEEYNIGIIVDDEIDSKKGDQFELLDIDAPTYNIPDSEPINIEYFEDGVQRTYYLGSVPSEEKQKYVPIFFTTVGAVIVKKEGKNIIRAKDITPIIEEYFIIPKIEILPKEFKDLIPKINFLIIPDELLEQPLNKIRKKILEDYVRSKLFSAEEDIIRKFDKQYPESWLVIDGPVSQHLVKEKKIGIIKRRRKEWFEGQYPQLMFKVQKNFINNRNEKIRSGRFKIRSTRSGKEFVSCYTKLLYHLNIPATNNPEFSLIRIETNLRHKDDFEQIINTILSYNTPICNPSDQWDKKIYPIYEAEKILRSYIKDEKIISAAFHRM